MRAWRQRACGRSVFALGITALAIQGCGLLPGASTRAPERTIEVSGVVASKELGVRDSHGFVSYTFDDGRTYQIATGTGQEPAVGDLLIAGTKPAPWQSAAVLHGPPDWPEGCYQIAGRGVETTTTIELDQLAGDPGAAAPGDGLAITKAPSFVWHNPVPNDKHLSGYLCLDKEGRVFQAESGGE